MQQQIIYSVTLVPYRDSSQQTVKISISLCIETWQKQENESVKTNYLDLLNHIKVEKIKTSSVVFALNCFECGLRHICEKHGLYFNDSANTYNMCISDDKFELFEQTVAYTLIIPNCSTLQQENYICTCFKSSSLQFSAIHCQHCMFHVKSIQCL